MLAEIDDEGNDPMKPLSVGPRWIVDILLNNKPCQALMDTGSQVSLINSEWHRQYLSHIPIKAKTVNTIDINGRQVTLTEALEVDVTISNQKTPCILFLKSKNNFNDRFPILLGTNFLYGFKNCDMSLFSNGCQMDSEGKLGDVRVANGDIVISPWSTVELPVMVSKLPPNIKFALVHEPDRTSLPTGLRIINALVPTNVSTLIVQNLSSVPIFFQQGDLVGTMYFCEYGDNILSTACTDAAEKLICAEGLDSKYTFGEEVEQTHPQWCEAFREKLSHYNAAFSTSEFDVGRANNGTVFDIELNPGPDIRERARPLAPRDFDECRQHINQLLEAGIIRPSHSPYASPIVLVRKKNGKLRMCVDYRKLNARTVRDSYNLPKIEDLLLTLSGSQYFTSLDLCKAYYQIPMTPKASKYSAFVTPFGLFEWDRLSFGLTNAPAVFQRLMENIFSDLNLRHLIIFIDDLLIHGKTLAELEERTCTVLQRLVDSGLKLDLSKCTFGTTSVKHLGYVVSDGNIYPDPDKTSAVKEWPKPQTVKQVKSFLGFCAYYRRFIPDFAKIAKPLNDLTLGYVPNKTQAKTKKNTRTLSQTHKPIHTHRPLHLNSSVVHNWGYEQERSFSKLKELLVSDLVLGLADRSCPFVMHIDASGAGLGAVLYQFSELEQRNKVIAYASRGLSKTESNYPAHKREFLALKWALTEKFKDYVLGAKVTVFTDNNPLVYVTKSSSLDATSHRWLSALSCFDFELKYKKGILNVDADSLSRLPRDEPLLDEQYKRSLEKISFLLDRAEEVDTIPFPVCSALIKEVVPNELSNEGDFSVPAVETGVAHPCMIDDNSLDPPMPHDFMTIDWKHEQMSDPILKVIIHHLKRNKRLSRELCRQPEMRIFNHNWSKFVFIDGVLYRRLCNDKTKVITDQLVVPQNFWKMALIGVHDDLFHTHYDDAVRHLRRRFFWPFMARMLHTKIKTCERCIRRGAKNELAPLCKIEATYPLELLSIDFLTIGVRGKKLNVLVMIDHFTKFGKACVTSDQTARTVARTLWREFFMPYGFPAKILSDQGRDFESDLIRELCDMVGIKKCRTTPYHPSSNSVERLNRTLLNMLRSLEDDKKLDLKATLPLVVHAYNCRNHESTQYSPYFLFFGRHPRLPVDLLFGLGQNRNKHSATNHYVRNLKKQLTEAYTRATENINQTHHKNKIRYDKTAHAAVLYQGDRVLVRKLGARVKSKIDDRWESGIYEVRKTYDKLPVYAVVPEGKRGPERILHRNYLFPIGQVCHTWDMDRYRIDHGRYDCSVNSHDGMVRQEEVIEAGPALDVSGDSLFDETHDQSDENDDVKFVESNNTDENGGVDNDWWEALMERLPPAPQQDVEGPIHINEFPPPNPVPDQDLLNQPLRRSTRERRPVVRFGIDEYIS